MPAAGESIDWNRIANSTVHARRAGEQIRDAFDHDDYIGELPLDLLVAAGEQEGIRLIFADTFQADPKGARFPAFPVVWRAASALALLPRASAI